MKKFAFALIISCLVSNFSNAQLLGDSIVIEGKTRYFHFNQPQNKAKIQTLIFMIHGSGGDGVGFSKNPAITQMDSLAQSEHVLVVYPDAYKRYWNECRKASPAEANVLNINEQGFFASMINYFQQKYSPKITNIFVMGVSGGGHMAYKLALTMPQQLKAITAIIANLPDVTNMDCIASEQALPVMIVNGTKDEINPYEGGEVNLGPIKMGAVKSTENTVKYWTNLAKYEGTPTKENLPDVDKNDGKTIEKYTYKTPNHPEIVLLKVIGGKHDFPNDINIFIEGYRFFIRQLK